MSLMDQLGGLLQRYTGAQATQAPATVHNDFDQLAQQAPPSHLADGLAAAFRSNETPSFGQMVGHLFGKASGEQRAGILNTLISALGPSVFSNILSRFTGGGGASSGLAGLLGGGQAQVTPEQAQQIPPSAVEQVASEAEKQNPSVIDQISHFYAQHPTLIKTLGGAALTVILARIAQREFGGT